jgi:hypothetical protein
MAAINKESQFRDALANFLAKVGESKAHWYSLKPLSKLIPCLSDALGISYDNMMIYFQCCGIAVDRGKAQGIRFYAEKFTNFLVVTSLESVCEHTTHYVAGSKSQQQHFVRLGMQSLDRLSKPGTGSPPRIRDITRVRNQFRSTISDIAIRCLGPNCQALAGPLAVFEETKEVHREPVEEEEKEDDPYEENLVFLQVRAHLLPLILDGNVLSRNTFWKKECSANEVESALLDIVRHIQEHREDKLTNILGSIRVQHSPETKSRENVFPIMKKYGIPLEERRVHKGLLKELFHMGKKVDKSTTLYADVGDNKESAFVFIPTSKGYKRLKKNENKHKWFSHLLTALGGDGNEQDTVRDLFVHVGRKEEYKEAFIEAIKMNGDRVIPQLDPVATFAIQSACNMNAAQFKTLRRCAFSEFGFQLFSSPHKIKQAIGLEHVEPIDGFYKYGSETIPWMYKSIQEIVCLFLATLLREGKANFKVDHIDLSICIDHGKGHSRVSLTLVVRRKDATGEWSEQQHVFSVANAKCRKDNSEIVRNTFGPSLNAELDAIKQSGHVSFFMAPVAEAFGACYAVFGTELARRENQDVFILTAPVTLWMSGDLLWYATALGKEGYAGWWCSYCQLFKTDWQAAGHAEGDLWTIAGLSDHADKIESGEVNGKIPRQRLGVKERPGFIAVDVDHYVFPMLHLTIGPVNDILKKFIEEMQAAGELYTDDLLPSRKRWARNKGAATRRRGNLNCI